MFQCALELCKILLALDDKYAIENFSFHRMSAMTELVIVNPKEVAGYLTHEFYEENYCLQHRIDILDVLTAASRLLSSIDKANNDEPVQKELQQYEPSDNWRDIVDRRIESKTRRFTKVALQAIEIFERIISIIVFDYYSDEETVIYT